jgi:hypothetical protein
MTRIGLLECAIPAIFPMSRNAQVSRYSDVQIGKKRDYEESGLDSSAQKMKEKYNQVSLLVAHLPSQWPKHLPLGWFSRIFGVGDARC